MKFLPKDHKSAKKDKNNKTSSYKIEVKKTS